jgi:tetratricopeptide (TPR) repeat protein
MYTLQGDHRNAEPCYAKCAKLEPKAREAWYAIGKIRAGRGDFAGAAQAYTKLTELEPKGHPLWVNLGVYQLNAGDPFSAILSFKQAIRLDPNQASYWANLGNAENIIGQYREAKCDCEIAVHMDPRRAEAWYNLAVVWADQGDSEKTAGAYSMAMRLNHNLPEGWFRLGSLFEEFNELGESLYCYDQASISQCPDERVEMNKMRLRGHGIKPVKPSFLSQDMSTLTQSTLDNVCTIDNASLQERLQEIMSPGNGAAQMMDWLLNGFPINRKVEIPDEDDNGEVSSRQAAPPINPKELENQESRKSGAKK